MSEKVTLVFQILLSSILLYTLFEVSHKHRCSNAAKWVMMLCSIGILAISDNVKLVIFCVWFSVAWFINHITAKKNGRTA